MRETVIMMKVKVRMNNPHFFINIKKLPDNEKIH
jgi:hypothetical protein